MRFLLAAAALSALALVGCDGRAVPYAYVKSTRWGYTCAIKNNSTVETQLTRYRTTPQEATADCDAINNTMNNRWEPRQNW